MKLFKSIFPYSLAAIFALVTMAPAEALTLDQARELYKAGKYAEAAPVFKAQLKRRPNDGSLNHWYGVCLFHEKKYAEAEKYLKVGVKRKVLESPHFLGDVYMAQYRFDDAAASYQDYIDALEKNKKQVPDSVTEAIARARKAKLMLNHVEQVQVIDSLIVDADSFFEHFKMTPESGRIGTAETLDVAIPDSTIGYMPQRGDKVFFGMPVEGKGYELCAMNKLTDGRWSRITPLPEGVNTTRNEAYPFFLNDGVTLYYASNGEGSIGGYDIFITRLNLENNTYLKPENVGMPFNSIYNDYMMAVDEMLNIGWFVSDREQILSVYPQLEQTDLRPRRNQDRHQIAGPHPLHPRLVARRCRLYRPVAAVERHSGGASGEASRLRFCHLQRSTLHLARPVYQCRGTQSLYQGQRGTQTHCSTGIESGRTAAPIYPIARDYPPTALGRNRVARVAVALALSPTRGV